ncbi:hypothetical protein ACOSQ3_004607 [Xanthoceras sorbifolium]
MVLQTDADYVKYETDSEKLAHKFLVKVALAKRQILEDKQRKHFLVRIQFLKVQGARQPLIVTVHEEDKVGRSGLKITGRDTRFERNWAFLRIIRFLHLSGRWISLQLLHT